MSISHRVIALSLLLLTYANPAHAWDSPAYYHRIVLAHGILASVAWVILIPLGAILFRLLHVKSFMIHAIIQSLALACYLAAVGTGLWMGITFEKLKQAHPILGLIILFLSLLQPILGLIHHSRSKTRDRLHLHSNDSTPCPESSITTESPPPTTKLSPQITATEIPNLPSPASTPKPSPQTTPSQNPNLPSRRPSTLPGYLHRYIGRITLTLAMINGGLGLLLQGRATRAENIAYGVVAGCIWIGYLSVVGGMGVKRQRMGFDARGRDDERSEVVSEK